MKRMPDEERTYILENYYCMSNKQMAAELERSEQYVKDQLKKLFESKHLRPKRPGKMSTKNDTSGAALPVTSFADGEMTTVQRMFQTGPATLKKHAFVMRKNLVEAIKVIAEAKHLQHKDMIEAALLRYIAGICRDDPTLVKKAFGAHGTDA